MKLAALLVALLAGFAVFCRLRELAGVTGPVHGFALLACLVAALGFGVAVYALCQPDPWEDTP